jgi:2-dehydropantoate 2-reductase
MHVAIVGAGALGRVYGARLEAFANAGVTYVVRPERTGETAPFMLERVDERDDVLRIDAPDRAAAIPAHADVVIVCVRANQLGDVVGLAQRAPDVPIVMMTPMMPGDYERLRGELGNGKRVVAGMPGVVAYVRHDDVVRYWVPRVAPTLIDAATPVHESTLELVHALERAKLHAKLELGVHETNPATTITFIPLMMALDVGSGVDTLLANDELVSLALDAANEGHALAQRIGKSATWVTLLTKFVGKTTLKIGVGIAKHHSPEAVAYVDEHFGRKLHAQNVAMARAIVELAKEKGTPHEALADLADRLARAP